MGLLGRLAAGLGAAAAKSVASSAAKGGNSSSGSGGSYSNNVFNVGSSGNAPAGLPMYTPVNTAGGIYTIVPPGTLGASYNNANGYFSVKGIAYPSYTEDAQNLANTYYNEQLDLINARDREAQEALRKQTQATIDSINSNIPKINQDYEAQQRANYISNEKAKAGMGDYLAAAGYSGGMAESTALGLQSNYENLRNSTDQEKNNALSELQNMVAQAQATGDTNLANLATQKYQSMLSAMQSARQSADAMAQWQQQTATDSQRYSDQLKQQAWENQNTLEQQAWNKSQDNIANALAQARAKTNSSSGSKYSTSQIVSMVNSGLISEEEGKQMLGLSTASATSTSTQSATAANGAYLNSLMARGLSGTSSVAANNILAAIQSGEITEAEGRKRLLALGIQI